jgi:hypothetical protein
MMHWQLGSALWASTLETPAVVAPVLWTPVTIERLGMFDDDMDRHPEMEQ